MKLATKIKTYNNFAKEEDLQEYAVDRLKEIHYNIPIIANPHSSQRNIANKQMSEKQRIAYFQKIKRENKKQGFQEGQSDLIACYPSHNAQFPAIAIELKTKGENPFRPFRSSGKMWIEASKSHKDVNHVMQQLGFIARMRKQGFMGIICAGKEQLDSIYNWYFKGAQKPETKSFTFMTPEWDKYTIEYLV